MAATGCVVVPLFNECDVLPQFQARLSAVLTQVPLTWEILYVNDGSTDHSDRVLANLQETDPRITVLSLSRNFGKEIALTAGLDHAEGDLVIFIDCDLQDPPELIPELIAGMRQGFDVVYAVRTARDGDTWLKRSTASLFYRLISLTSTVPLPAQAGDYRLLTRRAAEALRSLRESHRYMKGLYAWIGYPQLAVPYQRQSRHAGRTKWNYLALLNLAIEGFTSFTIAPLKIATVLGATVAGFAFVYALRIIYKTLVYGDPVQGYPSMMVVILFLGGVQLLCLGVVGEYLGRMFNETKRRPLYFVSGVARGGTAQLTSANFDKRTAQSGLRR